MLAKKLEAILGQPLVITNKGGGAGVPGFEYVMKARPDGYTISAPATPAFSASIFMRKKSYDLSQMTFAGAYMVNDRILLARADRPIAFCFLAMTVFVTLFYIIRLTRGRNAARP